MSGAPFSWMWGDPAEVCDRMRPLRQRMEAAAADLAEIERRRKSRRIRKLVALAKAKASKGAK